MIDVISTAQVISPSVLTHLVISIFRELRGDVWTRKADLVDNKAKGKLTSLAT